MKNEGEVHFAGKNLFKDGEFLKAVSITPGITSICAYKILGSFIVKRDADYLFMDGRVTGPVRWVLIDCSSEQQRNAISLSKLGVPIVSEEDAQRNYTDAGIPMLDVTR